MVTVSQRVASFLDMLSVNGDNQWYTRKEIAERAGVSKSPTLVAILNQYVKAGTLERAKYGLHKENPVIFYRIVLRQMPLPGMEDVDD